MIDDYRYFLEFSFIGVNRLFFLVYSNANDNTKTYKAQRYYLSKSIMKKYNVIINRINVYDQPIDFDITPSKKEES